MTVLVACAVALFHMVGFADALNSCAINPTTNGVECSLTLFQGRCVRPYEADERFWCHWDERSIDMCCAARDDQCCKARAQAGEYALTVILIILIVCCCCCIGLSRATAPPPIEGQQPTRLYRFLSLFGLQPEQNEPHDAEDGFPNQLMRDGTTLEPVRLPRFVFPKLKPDPSQTEPRECIVCFAEARNAVLPCGHCVLCEECCKLMLSRRQPCPTCRVPFGSYALADSQPTFRDLSLLTPGGSLKRNETQAESESGRPIVSTSSHALELTSPALSSRPTSQRAVPMAMFGLGSTPRHRQEGSSRELLGSNGDLSSSAGNSEEQSLPSSRLDEDEHELHDQADSTAVVTSSSQGPRDAHDSDTLGVGHSEQNLDATAEELVPEVEADGDEVSIS